MRCPRAHLSSAALSRACWLATCVARAEAAACTLSHCLCRVQGTAYSMQRGGARCQLHAAPRQHSRPSIHAPSAHLAVHLLVAGAVAALQVARPHALAALLEAVTPLGHKGLVGARLAARHRQHLRRAPGGGVSCQGRGCSALSGHVSAV
jgi:hypothetical protein